MKPNDTHDNEYIFAEMVAHTGNAHYVAYQRDRLDANSWRLCNDSSITHTADLNTNRIRSMGHGKGKRVDKSIPKRPRGCNMVATVLVYIRRGSDFYRPATTLQEERAEHQQRERERQEAEAAASERERLAQSERDKAAAANRKRQREEASAADKEAERARKRQRLDEQKRRKAEQQRERRRRQQEKRAAAR